ncbi:DUF6082 family protein [Actinoplanes sp. NPDC020271]|uniref:DUF6082 family protein n=1 Tax=Actinoplanes sp. NPDC020271 TaxID=3363896 RepID=UPI0037AA238E
MVAWVNVAKPAGMRRNRIHRWSTGVALVAVLTLAVPLLMMLLSVTALPWARLADVGDAFGGVSAVLSALALSGVGASLLFQQRQIRQELADLDRQQHMELLKLAIEHPELIEVLDSETAATTHPRHEIYANLTMMYWLAIWQLGEIDDAELHGMARSMFRSDISRQWWSRVGSEWIGTRLRPERHRFLEIITREHEAAAACDPPTTRPRPATRGVGHALPWLIALTGGIVLGGLYRRRNRSARISSMKARQDSDS